ncbi:MAG: stage V sporulation protein AC [Anaerotignum sp.]|nr:stage V sporulation protein AC [Anaerotignum sp.]
MVKQASPKSPIFKDCVRAFISGGLICTLGQSLLDWYTKMDISEKDAALWVSVTLIGLSALLTALGIYEKLGKYCGAGTIVPITGFANSVVSPAIEFKKEGMVFGMAAKMFIVAGPVIVYGTLTSMLVGFVYYFVK